MNARSKVGNIFVHGLVSADTITRQFVVPAKCRILRVHTLMAPNVVGDDLFYLQVSQRSTYVPQVDPIVVDNQVICHDSLQVNSVTAAGIVADRFAQEFNVDVPIIAGQLIFIHTSATNESMNWAVNLHYVKES